MAKEAKTKEPVKAPTAQEQIDAYLKDTEEYHYNFVVNEPYKVSSGSLKLDIEMGGGMRPGIMRLCGITEGGKTSCALSFARNFQKTVGNSHVVYFKSEGRLSEEILTRAGIDQSPEKFRVIKCNVYEVVLNLVSTLIHSNPGGVRYLFIIDSMDSLNRRDDLFKTFGGEEGNIVAGTAGMTTDFLKKLSLPIGELGHACILISQVRTPVNVSKYVKVEPKITGSSGGHALLHYSDWILEFQARNKKEDKIESVEGSGDFIGHFCKIIFRKSMNEKTSKQVDYPIRYGRSNGQSVWVEREVVDLLMMFELVTKKGSWLVLDESTLKEASQAGITLPQQCQGKENLIKFFEENPNCTQYFYNKFRDALQKSA